jgi:prepilin-type N-terminal cleavage/methylation domain-containing protein
MITFNSLQNRPGRWRSAGFTLAEMMVTVSLLGLVLLAIIPTFSVFTKSVAGLGNYASMSRDSRGGLEWIARDFHAAESLSKATATEIRLTLPVDAGGGTVHYKYVAGLSPERGTFTRELIPASGTAKTFELFDDVEAFNMVYYNKLGVDVTSSASILDEAKSVQLNAKLEKSVISTANTDYIISARFLMRNK